MAPVRGLSRGHRRWLVLRGQGLVQPHCWRSCSLGVVLGLLLLLSVVLVLLLLLQQLGLVRGWCCGQLARHLGRLLHQVLPCSGHEGLLGERVQLLLHVLGQRGTWGAQQGQQGGGQL